LNVLVTGGAGFVGSHTVDRLLDDGHDVMVVDDLSSGRRERVNVKADLAVCDIRDTAGLDVLLESRRPEAIVHAAAQAEVRRSLADPRHDADVNVLGSISLLAAAERAGVRRVVYFSTGGAGYGDTPVLPTPETHPMQPSTPYGVSKIAAESYLACWSGLTGVPTVALRLANVYGPHQNPHGEAGVVAIFLHRLLRGEPCLVNGDGEQTRDYVYVGDVADAVARAVVRPDVTGALNIGTGRQTSVNALHHELAAAIGVVAPPRHRAPTPGEQRRSALDPTRAEQTLGWRARTPLGEGARITLAHARESLTGMAQS
jgi:UDP-glucose 4-epimerase